MRRVVGLPLIVLVLAACGGGHHAAPSCAVYDRNGSAYVTVSGIGTPADEARACERLARTASEKTGLFWSRFRGANLYRRDVLICKLRHGTAEVDVYDRRPTSPIGTSFCARAAATKGWSQIG